MKRILNKSKHILVGKDEDCKTIQQALNCYSRGKLIIELTSDILDEDDIHVSQFLKQLVIKSSVENESKLFLKTNIIIYLHNVETLMQDIGTKDEPTGYIVGSSHSHVNMKLSLKRCNLMSVIGAFEARKIERFCLDVHESYVTCICGSYEIDGNPMIETMDIDLNGVQGSCVHLFSKKKIVDYQSKQIRLKMAKCHFDHISTFQSSYPNLKNLDCQMINSTIKLGINKSGYDASQFLMRIEESI